MTSYSILQVAHFRTMDAAERRKQMIEESKYLGGDMEHTHLVKGLDYALLQKVCHIVYLDVQQFHYPCLQVRSEITSKEKEGEELEKIYLARKTEREEVEGQLKSTLCKIDFSDVGSNIRHYFFFSEEYLQHAVQDGADEGQRALRTETHGVCGRAGRRICGYGYSHDADSVEARVSR